MEVYTLTMRQHKKVNQVPNKCQVDSHQKDIVVEKTLRRGNSEEYGGGEEGHSGGDSLEKRNMVVDSRWRRLRSLTEEEHGVGEEELRNTRSYWQRSSDPAGPARL